MVMKILTILLILLHFSLLGASFTSTQGGLFNAGSTWVGGSAPSTAGDTWTIASGHTVVYNVDNSAGAGWGASVVTGTLLMSNTIPCYLKMNGNLSGGGDWKMGSATELISFSNNNTPSVVVEFASTYACTMTKNGALQWYGETNRLGYGRLTATAATNATYFTIDSVPTNLGTNCLVTIGRYGVAFNSSTFHLVDHIDGNNVYVQTGTLTDIQTNTLYGCAITPLSSYARSNNTLVIFLSCPIVVLEKTQGTTYRVTCNSNYIQGTRFQNLGRAFVNGGNGQRFIGCSAINCTGSGAFVYNGANCYVDRGFGAAIAYGLLRSCPGSTVLNSVGVGYNGAWGFAYGGGYGGYVSNCIVANMASAGLAVGVGCRIVDCKTDTLASSAFSGLNNSIVIRCLFDKVVNGVSQGSMDTVFKDCIITNAPGSGSLLWRSFGHTTINLTNYSPSYCLTTESANNWFINSDTTPWANTFYYYDPYCIYQYDSSLWRSQYGNVAATNTIGENYRFIITNSAGPVVMNLQLPIRPTTTRNITISCYKTNNVDYYASVGYGKWFPQNQELICAGAASGGWTNIVLSVVNTSNWTETKTLWIEGRASSVPATGYIYLDLGADLITVKH